MEIKVDLGIILAIYAAGVVFGIGYNHVVAWAERKRYLEGYESLAVAGSVLFTLGLTAIFNVTFALLALGSFFCSGLPMVVGSIWRHIKAREQEQDAIREEASQYHWKTELPSPLDEITESMARLAANITDFFCHPHTIPIPKREGKANDE